MKCDNKGLNYGTIKTSVLDVIFKIQSLSSPVAQVKKEFYGDSNCSTNMNTQCRSTSSYRTYTSAVLIVLLGY